MKKKWFKGQNPNAVLMLTFEIIGRFMPLNGVQMTMLTYAFGPNIQFSIL